MKTHSRIVVIVMGLALFLASCSTIRVSQDYPETLNASSVKTYALTDKPRDKTGDARSDSPLIDERIRSAIGRTLPQKGLEPASGNPDIIVSYQYSIRSKLSSVSSGPSIGFGVGSYRSGTAFSVGTSTDLQPYDEAQLIIDFTQNDSQQLIWRGMATFRMETLIKPDQITKRINEAVKKIMGQFPPKVN